MGHILSKRCCGADPCSSIIHFLSYQFGLLYSLLRWPCSDGDNPSSIGIGGYAFMLMPCDSSHCCVSTYQQWLSLCWASCVNGISADFEYLRLGISHSCRIWVTDRNNASSLLWSLPELYHGDALLLILWVIIEAKCLFQIFPVIFLVKIWHDKYIK